MGTKCRYLHACYDHDWSLCPADCNEDRLYEYTVDQGKQRTWLCREAAQDYRDDGIQIVEVPANEPGVETDG